MTIQKYASIGRKSGRTAGFTLIEILLVIVIILLVAGALVVFVIPQQEVAEKNTTRMKLTSFAQALDTYRVNVGHYPTEDEGGLEALSKKPTFENERLGEKWAGPYIKPGTDMSDAWGYKIEYEVVDRSLETESTGLPFKLYSVGPDGQPDTEDDIKYATGGEDGTLDDFGTSDSSTTP